MFIRLSIETLTPLTLFLHTQPISPPEKTLLSDDRKRPNLRPVATTLSIHTISLSNITQLSSSTIICQQQATPV